MAQCHMLAPALSVAFFLASFGGDCREFNSVRDHRSCGSSVPKIVDYFHTPVIEVFYGKTRDVR